MMADGFWFFGMHAFWWVFWLALLILVVYVLFSGAQRQEKRKTPREILDQRFAAGEISTQEYEERRKKLEQG